VRNALALVAGVLLGVSAASCGSGDEKCPGVICNNCAVDCTSTCSAGQTEYCVSLSQFGGDPNLRCDYCR
jgi:hypothetical protein